MFRTVLKMQERAKVCKERVVEDNSLKHERTGGENSVKLCVSIWQDKVCKKRMVRDVTVESF